MSGSASSGSSGQLITSEEVLERLFRAGYTRWIEDAKKRLGPDAAASAPRVVSKVFHLAWTDRARFHSQDELDAFLGANIQHQSARELSRKASAGRLDATHKEHKSAGKEMTLDEAWAALKPTLQGGAPEAYRKRASSARHEAAEHMANLGQRSNINWKPMAALGLVGLIAALGLVWYVQKAGADRAVMHALSAPDVRNYESSYGQAANIKLDDSTNVRIGPETKLTVPKMFGIELRAVKVEGAIGVDMSQFDANHPFQVMVGNVLISTSGVSSFAVTKFRDDSSIIVLAKKGALEVRDEDVVKPVAEGTALLIVASTKEMRVPTSEELAEATSWTDGRVSILNRNLRGALPKLKRWYGLDIHVEDQSLLDRPVFVNADLTSKNAAIKAVEESGNLKFTYIGDNMAFTDSKKPAARGATRR